MEMWNKATLRQGIPNLFDQSTINAYKECQINDPQYPNFNWMDYGFRTSPVNKHNLSVSGGTKNTHFYTHLGFLDQDGIVIGHNYKKYTGQINLDTKINSFITLVLMLVWQLAIEKNPGFMIPTSSY